MKIASSPFAVAPEGPLVFGIPVDFALFGMTLLGVALFHQRTLRVALAGSVTIAIYKIVFTGFKTGPGVMGFVSHVGHEWVILANLLCLLMGFALLSRHFEKSHVPVVLSKYLPHDWKGGFVLLVMVWILSSFLDNIAGALIGGAMAHQLFRGRVHVGYLAAIVAASNAGGAWSVLGDTTTTMLWIAGVPAVHVLHAAIGSGAALIAFGIPASLAQHRLQPILANPLVRVKTDWKRVGAVATVLAGAVAANLALDFPAAGVWAALLLWAPFVGLPRQVLPKAARGALFLASLVLIASLMPVEKLPAASLCTTPGPGFVSAFFVN